MLQFQSPLVFNFACLISNFVSVIVLSLRFNFHTSDQFERFNILQKCFNITFLIFHGLSYIQNLMISIFLTWEEMCYFCDIYHVRETPSRKLEKIMSSRGLELLIYINLPFPTHISCFSWMFLKLWFYHMYMFLLEYLISLCMPIGAHTSMLAGTGMCVPLLA